MRKTLIFLSTFCILLFIIAVSGCTDSHLNSYNVGDSKFKLGSEWEKENISSHGENSDPPIYSKNFKYQGSKIASLTVMQFQTKSSFDNDYEKELYVSNHGNWSFPKNETINGVHIKTIEDKVVSGLGKSIFYFFEKNNNYYRVNILSQDPYDNTFDKTIKTIISTIN